MVIKYSCLNTDDEHTLKRQETTHLFAVIKTSFPLILHVAPQILVISAKKCENTF